MSHSPTKEMCDLERPVVLIKQGPQALVPSSRALAERTSAFQSVCLHCWPTHFPQSSELTL